MIKSFEMNRPKTYTGSGFYVGWMRSMFVCDIYPLAILNMHYDENEGNLNECKYLNCDPHHRSLQLN